MHKKALEIEKKLELLLVILPVKISSHVIDQDLIFEDSKQLDFEYVTLELSKNTEIPNEKLTTTLLTNIIGQILLQKWVLMSIDMTQANISF